MTEAEKLKELSEETLAKIISGNAKCYSMEQLLDILEKAFKSHHQSRINSISDEQRLLDAVDLLFNKNFIGDKVWKIIRNNIKNS